MSKNTVYYSNPSATGDINLQLKFFYFFHINYVYLLAKIIIFRKRWLPIRNTCEYSYDWKLFGQSSFKIAYTANQHKNECYSAQPDPEVGFEVVVDEGHSQHTDHHF